MSNFKPSTSVDKINLVKGRDHFSEPMMDIHRLIGSNSNPLLI